MSTTPSTTPSTTTGNATEASAAEPYVVTFVCTGNICRSPMAEIMAREAFDAAGLGTAVRVESAGTGGWHVGDDMDPRTASELAEIGLEARHEAQQVDARLLDSDLLVALDAGHRSALLHSGADPDRVRLLRSFDPEAHGEDVEDPYYGTQRDFHTVRLQIAAALPGLVAFVRAAVGAEDAPGA